MALTSCSRLMSSFDWQTALPHGQSNLPPSILVMSDSRHVLTMSQETSSPCGSLVARMSQIFILQALRACLSARSSGVSSCLPPSGAAAVEGLSLLSCVAPGKVETSIAKAAIRATRTNVMELPLAALTPGMAEYG